MDLQIQPVVGGGGTWDLVRDADGDFVVVGDTEATWGDFVVQEIAYAVLVWLGELGFDRSAGFPWEQSVFGRQPIEGVSALLYEHTTQVEVVDGMDQPPVIEFDKANRQLTITAQVRAAGFEVSVALVIEDPT